MLAEAARVLRPGGRFAVSDVIADPDMDEATRADMAAWTGCIAGALTEDEFRAALADAGLADIEIRHDAPRPRARGVGDRPGAQAVTDELQLNDPQTLYRRWEDSQWSPFDDRPRRRTASSGRRWRSGARADPLRARRR